MVRGSQTSRGTLLHCKRSQSRSTEVLGAQQRRARLCEQHSHSSLYGNSTGPRIISLVGTHLYIYKERENRAACFLLLLLRRGWRRAGRGAVYAARAWAPVHLGLSTHHCAERTGCCGDERAFRRGQSARSVGGARAHGSAGRCAHPHRGGLCHVHPVTARLHREDARSQRDGALPCGAP
jgi:hypothetical protein